MTSTRAAGPPVSGAKRKIRYRPGDGFFRVERVNFGTLVVRPHHDTPLSRDDWREWVIGPYATLSEAYRGGFARAA